MIKKSRGYYWYNFQFSGITLLLIIVLKPTTAMVPFIGWLIADLFILNSFGAIIRTINWKKESAIPIA